MKHINITLWSFLSVLGLGLCACSETTDPVIGATTPATLKTPSADSFVLVLENEAEPMTTLAWDAASFGAQVAISYDVQMDIAGNNFANPTLLGSTAETSMDVMTGEINKQLLNRDLPASKPADIELRIVSAIEKAVYESSPSNVIKVSITPYSGEKVYPMLYVPGEFQGWAPDKAATIYSVSGDGTYTGYVWINGEFKFTSQPNWDGINYGIGASEGNLSISTDQNIQTPEGYYLASVNTNTLTYKLTLATWGLIGDATPGGWDTDTPLVYDLETMLLKADVTLKDGTFKFRTNNSWDVNMGGSLEALVAGGDNITVSAGTYTVVLDLHRPIYKATLTKK